MISTMGTRGNLGIAKGKNEDPRDPWGFQERNNRNPRDCMNGRIGTLGSKKGRIGNLGIPKRDRRDSKEAL